MILSAVNNRPCISIAITDDSVPEPEELFEVTLINLRRITANVFAYQVTITLTNITIIDDDGEYTCILELTYCMQKRSTVKPLYSGHSVKQPPTSGHL